VLKLGLGLKFGFGLRLWLLKDVCDNNKHQKLSYNMGGKFKIPAGKQKNLPTAPR